MAFAESFHARNAIFTDDPDLRSNVMRQSMAEAKRGD